MAISKDNKKKESFLHCYSGEDDNIASDVSSNEEKIRRRSSGGLPPTFPVDLYKMLEQTNIESLDYIVSWQPHGRAFIVHNQTVFVRDILPRFFRSKKFTSFVRQLNLYEFRRISRGKDKGAYYHPKFLRGRSSLVDTMRRTRVNGKKIRFPSDPGAEPDFYSMPPLDGWNPQPREIRPFCSKNESTVKSNGGSRIGERKSHPREYHNKVPNIRDSWSRSQSEFDQCIAAKPNKTDQKINEEVHQFADVFGDSDCFAHWISEPNNETDESTLYNPIPFCPIREELESTRVATPEVSLCREERKTSQSAVQYAKSYKETDETMIEPVPLDMSEDASGIQYSYSFPYEYDYRYSNDDWAPENFIPVA